MKTVNIIKDDSEIEAVEIATLSNGDKVIIIDGIVAIAEKVKDSDEYEYIVDVANINELIQGFESILSITQMLAVPGMDSPWKIMKEGKEKQDRLNRLEDLFGRRS